MRINSNNFYNYFPNKRLSKTGNKITLIQNSSKNKNGSIPEGNQIINDRLRQLKMLNDHLKLTKSQSKEDKNKKDVFLKCLEISRRILAGDEVPPADHKYLMENNPELYLRSILMKKYQDCPRKYKQLTEDEDIQDQIRLIQPESDTEDIL